MKKKNYESGLSAWHERWKSLSIKANLSGAGALAAVKEDGFALRYVNEQLFDRRKKLKGVRERDYRTSPK